MFEFLCLFYKSVDSCWNILLQLNLNYPDSLGPDEIVQIIKNMNINKEQKLINLRKRRLIVKQIIYKTF